MKRNIYSVFIVTLLFSIISLSSVMAQKTLRIGDQAPEIKASKWFKGTPVNNIEKGKIYVVEFWATWCGPCKASIPHISKLAEKYKDKITFVGMDASEKEASQKEKVAIVDKFMKGTGKQMNYNVALDEENGYMKTNWLNASAQMGIPAAFIIGKDSKIAWIGHPMDMEETLGQIVEDKYDGRNYAEKYKIEQEKNARITVARAKLAEIGSSLKEARKNKDDAKVVSESEKLLEKHPELQKAIDEYYMPALLRINPDKLFAIAKEAKANNSSERMQSVILFTSHKGVDKKFYDLSIDYLLPIVEKDPKNLISLGWLEKNYEMAGNKEKAIEITNKILSITGQDKEVYKTINQAYESKLQELKAGK